MTLPSLPPSPAPDLVSPAGSLTAFPAFPQRPLHFFLTGISPNKFLTFVSASWRIDPSLPGIGSQGGSEDAGLECPAVGPGPASKERALGEGLRRAAPLALSTQGPKGEARAGVWCLGSRNGASTWVLSPGLGCAVDTGVSRPCPLHNLTALFLTG